MTLEDKLIDNLVTSYKIRGINVQRMLDNPLFQSLSLSEKIRAIDRYATELKTAPTIDSNVLKRVGKMAVIGGLGGVGTAAAHMLMTRDPKDFMQGRYKVALGLGAAIAAGGELYRRVQINKQDTQTAKTIAANPVGALIGRTTMRPIAGAPSYSPISESKLIDTAKYLSTVKFPTYPD